MMQYKRIKSYGLRN